MSVVGARSRSALPALVALAVSPWAAACTGGAATGIVLDVEISDAVPFAQVNVLEVSIASSSGTSLQDFPVFNELEDRRTSIWIDAASYADTISVGIVARSDGDAIAAGAVNGIALMRGEVLAVDVLLE